ncbi:hypothetical protein PR202_ga03444 [Eleusine coracana subsp. coracana]|uniref:Uncharacterized protein n=1 Tax=Eleusine coracana subsp. coracana TaxID=191504 RepID=A0AAV5BP26_ELECO|nr:hypothetical protein PR202_ga03444 [Eleusine coracana subsp. coracana]
MAEVIAGCAIAVVAILLCSFLYAAWVAPAATRRRLRRFEGPRPSFPLGNLAEIAASSSWYHHSNNNNKNTRADAGEIISGGDIHGRVFPYFARWRSAFGKVFVYWLGTEPFLYVADPEFLKSITAGALGKSWGKPDVFRRDRMLMFGRGLMLKEWSDEVASGEKVIDVERGVVRNAAEIIAQATFGLTDDARVFQKLQAMQAMLFQSNRLVGVPMARLLHLRKSYEAWKLGREIDALLLHIIQSRQQRMQLQGNKNKRNNNDLLSLLLAAAGNDHEDDSNNKSKKKLTTRELVDECKTFFFGGHETTALALSWTLLMLAAHPEWQTALREEIQEVLEDGLNAASLGRLTKMGWVMNEVLRLYPPSPNVQRQALRHIDDQQIPAGTNMWVDVVAMHHDPDLWGDDVNDFRPERFAKDPVHGGCRHRMGFLPFGFGGRICVGRNLTAMEYRVVLSMLLPRFHLSVAPQYRHAPRIMLSLRPSNGIQLQLTPIN